nr:4-alpha-glucanotransferase [Dissulfurirhabdus thermomarina]
MGIDTSDEAALRRAAADRAARPFRRGLDPVAVVRAGERPRLELRLPESALGTAYEWVLVEEGGRVRGGRIHPLDLEVVERVETDGRTWARCRFRLPALAGPGRHRLELRPLGALAPRPAPLCLVVTPGACLGPEAVVGGDRVWGLAVQLYGLRSRRNWGIGDFTDLAAVVEWAAGAGADLVGLNPLGLLFPAEPERASPYSPSHRGLLNPLYIDVEAVEELAECAEARGLVSSPAFRGEIDALRRAEFVDYAGVARAKFRVLERLWAHFRRRHLDPPSARGREFFAFCAAGGDELLKAGLFEALAAHLSAASWRAWPPGFRSPDAEGAQAFLERHPDRVAFHLYLQWLAERQLAAVRRRARAAGLRLGLYLDLPVGVDGGGAEAWGDGSCCVPGVGVGAPPDDFNPGGQGWGVVPFDPAALREAGHGPFARVTGANLRRGGVLRVDHVMGLMRLFWVPEGLAPAEGAYVRYPFRELLGVLALESRRHGCVVVGEDLGTVPDEVRAALGPAGVLSYRVLYFEREGDGAFKAPGAYPAGALAVVSTHDLPTLRGWWTGRDIALRERLGLFPDPGLHAAQAAARSADRHRLLEALRREGLAPDGAAATEEVPPWLAVAVHRYLARSAARVFMVQLEDLAGQEDQANLPGTPDRAPNWRRKLPVDLEALRDDPGVRALLEAVDRERRAT